MSIKPAVAILLLLCSPLLAVEPKAVITGDSSAPAPGVIVLDSKGSVYDLGELIWIVSDDSVQSMEGKDGRMALFYMKPTPVAIKVVLVSLGTVNGVPKMAIAKQAIVFGGPAPPPNPNPPPTPTPPTPGPTPDAGKYNIAPLVYQWANATQSSTRSADAQKLATALDGVTAKVAALPANYTDCQKVQNEWQNALIALRDDKVQPMILTPWVDFQNKFNAEIDRQNKLAAGGFKTPSQFCEFLAEASTGLKAVR